jgi:hypothetical protein
MSGKLRVILLLGLLLQALGSHAQPFDLAVLSKQLSQHRLVRGPFIQEKYLRGLPQPLISSGEFILASDDGLLWQLRKPLSQDYRINAKGIAQRSQNGWKAQAANTVAAQQSRLFLDVLKGNPGALAQDFDLQLSGHATAWKLRLLPRSALIKQVFSGIEISGGALVERIELQEAQGDRSLLRMPASHTGGALSQQEQRDFAD